MRYNKGTVILTKDEEQKEYVLDGITLTEHGITGEKEGTWAQVKDDTIIIYKAQMENKKNQVPKIIISVLDTSNVWEVKDVEDLSEEE